MAFLSLIWTLQLLCLKTLKVAQMLWHPIALFSRLLHVVTFHEIASQEWAQLAEEFQGFLAWPAVITNSSEQIEHRIYFHCAVPPRPDSRDLPPEFALEFKTTSLSFVVMGSTGARIVWEAESNGTIYYCCLSRD